MKGNILIADDHPGIRLLLSEVFTYESYNIKLAATGQEVLEKIKEYSFDLILLDYNLPIYDGIEVINRLKKSGFSTPTVFMSGMSEAIKDKVSKYSFVKHIIKKPFNLEDIQELVRETLALANEM